MKDYKKDIDNIFGGIEDERTELPQSAKKTIARLTFKEKKPKRVFVWKKWMTAVASVFLIIPLVLILALQPWAGKEGDIINKPDTAYGKGGVNYIALAAYKNVQDNGGSKAKAVSFAMFAETQPLSEHAPNEIWEDENGNLHVSYPYDYIKICRAIQFEITVSFSEGFFAAACGIGDVKVIIADFDAYMGEYDESIISGGGGEKIIIFIGTEGIYSCLIDGGAIDSWDFSSHKTITGEAVEKDTTFPIRRFNVKRSNGSYSLDYKIAVSDWGADELMESYIMKPGSLIEVSEETLYSVIELMQTDEFIVNATVESFADGEITLSGNQTTNLKYALINDRTEILINGEQATIEQIIAGINVKITYDKYYDIYNPVKTVVLKIEILRTL